MSIPKRFVVKKRSISDALAAMPVLSPLGDNIPSLDLLIGACGFEERILSIPNHLSNRGAKIKHGIFFGNYLTNPSENSQREKELAPLLNSLSDKVIYFDAESPEKTYHAISTAIKDVESSTIEIGLDISGGSSTFIISTLLSTIRTNTDAIINLTVFYTTAIKYHEPSKNKREEPVSLWNDSDLRERGVVEVAANELAPGIQHDHLPSYAIAIPSMFPARLQRALSHLGMGTLSGADENIFWVLPTTDNDTHQWRQAQVKQSLMDMIYGSENPTESSNDLPDGQWAYCDALDYKACARLIVNQIDEHSGTNVSVIHAGTKLQSVGVALALSARQEAALIKSRPQNFSAENYSSGIGESYSIKFNDLKDITRALAAVGSFDIENS